MIEIVLNLPFPPSVNSIWRQFRGRAILSARARDWWVLAEGMFLQQKRSIANKKISGRFAADIVYARSKRGRMDLGNLNKLPLDAAQKFGLINNDRDCDDLRERWGDIEGCQVTLREVV